MKWQVTLRSFGDSCAILLVVVEVKGHAHVNRTVVGRSSTVQSNSSQTSSRYSAVQVTGECENEQYKLRIKHGSCLTSEDEHVATSYLKRVRFSSTDQQIAVVVFLPRKFLSQRRPSPWTSNSLK